MHGLVSIVKTVVLIHQREVLHYRVAIYNRLAQFLQEQGWRLVVIANGVQRGSPHAVRFELRDTPRNTQAILAAVRRERPAAVILFVNASEPYLFPVLLTAKLRRIPVIYWGHGIDLEDKSSRIKRLIYSTEHALCDALLLYSEDLRRYVAPRFHAKTFVARNTIDTSLLARSAEPKQAILARYGINTPCNVICVGRLQRRKRIADLLQAFERIAVNHDYGLILVGPDEDGCLDAVSHPRIFKMGPLYDRSVADLLGAADVYCMPGHVGLGIVDAMFFGLPFVTEDVDHAPEIMYLRDGVNGYKVPPGDIEQLAARIGGLLADEQLRARFSAAARETIERDASLERMFGGFAAALRYVSGS
jgi:glycosyltransferase involved in cell wall biosynthesis